jgi:hypothetical protein
MGWGYTLGDFWRTLGDFWRTLSDFLYVGRRLFVVGSQIAGAETDGRRFASRFGVCCLFLVSSSGSTISQNCTYIRNPSFPSVYGSTTAVSYTIQKCTSGNGKKFDFNLGLKYMFKFIHIGLQRVLLKRVAGFFLIQNTKTG